MNRAEGERSRLARGLLGRHGRDVIAPWPDELALALDLLRHCGDTGVDLPDVAVMAMAAKRKAEILTWDFRLFRAVVLRRGHHWPLVVQEHELPGG